MASELRVNKLTNRSGLGTVTYTDTGAIVSGIVTANSFSGDVSISEKIIHTGDTNTFMKFDTDTVTFETAGDERLRIKSNGKVGIGTDPEALLEVYRNNNQTGGIIQVTQDGIGDAAIDFQLKGTREYSLGIDNSDSDKFKLSGSAGLDNNTLLTVTNAGDVGIGTISPSGILHTHAATGTQRSYFEASAGHSFLRVRTASTSYNAGIEFRAAATEIANITGLGAGGLNFEVGGSERLKITSGGMVLIGETSVAGGSQKLVIGQGGAENFEFTPGVSAQNGGVLEYIHRGDTATRPDLSMYVSGGAFKVYTAGYERFHINTSGNTGIGTASVTHRLHTQGTGNSGGVRFENSHDTTTVSGNTASGAFPHNILLSNYQGSGHAFNRMASIGFDIPTAGSHANATIAYQAEDNAGNGNLQFWLEEDNTSRERLRITSHGQLQATSAADVRFTLGSSGTAGTNDSVHIRADSADLKFMAASGGTTLFESNGNETFRITSGGNIGVNCDSPTSITNSRGITLQASGGTAAGFINFMDSADNSDARVLADDGSLYIHADASDNTADSLITFNVDSSEKARINYNGNFTVQRYTVASENTSGDFKITVSGLTNNGGNNWRKCGVFVIYNGINPNATSSRSAVGYFGVGSVSTWNWLGTNEDDVFTADTLPVTLDNATATSFRLNFNVADGNTGSVTVFVNAWNVRPIVSIAG